VIFVFYFLRCLSVLDYCKGKIWVENLECICVFVIAKKGDLQVVILRSVHVPHEVKSDRRLDYVRRLWFLSLE